MHGTQKILQLHRQKKQNSTKTIKPKDTQQNIYIKKENNRAAWNEVDFLICRMV